MVISKRIPEIECKEEAREFGEVKYNVQNTIIGWVNTLQQSEAIHKKMHGVFSKFDKFQGSAWRLN